MVVCSCNWYGFAPRNVIVVQGGCLGVCDDEEGGTSVAAASCQTAGQSNTRSRAGWIANPSSISKSMTRRI